MLPPPVRISLKTNALALENVTEMRDQLAKYKGGTVVIEDMTELLSLIIEQDLRSKCA